tara:strand:+ start:4787 stop:5359 length:573 start_codon:yes stop_codon:yes gene_type:complete
MLTNTQWELYTAQYGGLIHTIAKKISGDNMLASYEDNVQDLNLAAVESVVGYERLTGEGFDEAFGTKTFDQYTKTVLWNRKAKKGIALTKKMPFRSKMKTIIDNEGKDFEIEDPGSASGYSGVILDRVFEDADEDVTKVINAILSDPTVVTVEGKLKNGSIGRIASMSPWRVSDALVKIKRTLEKNYGTN